VDFYAGKTVLITGASRGIGAEFARQLAHRGARLLLTARSEEDLQNLARSLEAETGLQSQVYRADLSRPGAAAELYRRITAGGHQVDILVNNAGFGRWTRFDTTDLSLYESMIELNVKSLVALTWLVLPEMLRREAGAILNVASNAAFQPTPYFGVYAATKSFVLNFSQSLWAEYRGHGIHVTALCPGATETHFHEVAGADLSKMPLVSRPEEVVRIGLRALERNRPYVVSGKLNALMARMVHFVPARRLLIFAEKAFRSQVELPQDTEQHEGARP